MTSSRRNHLLLILALAVIAALFAWPVCVHMDYWGIEDWDAFEFRSAVSRATILQYGQFPLWNPFSCGGMPHLAQPETDLLSLPFLFELLLGVIWGNKISIIVHLFIGLVGTYLLARRHALDLAASLVAAFVYMLSSMYILTLTVGMVSGYAIAYIPWAFRFFLKALENPRHAVATALTLAMMWFAGGIYPFCMSLLLMAVYAAVAVLGREYALGTTARVLGAILLLTFLLGAVKFLPAIEFTRQYPRQTDLYSGFSLESLTYGLLGRDQTLDAIDGKSTVDGFVSGFSLRMDEIGMYVGVIPVLLFLVGLAHGMKRYQSLAITLFLFLWLGFGFRSQPLSLWAMVHAIPPFSIMRVAERFRYVFMLGFALFAGIGVQALTNWLSARYPGGKWSTRMALVLAGVILIDLLLVNSPVFDVAFSIPPIPVPTNKSFFQIDELPDYDKFGVVPGPPDVDSRYSSFGAEYPAFLGNAGTIKGYESMPVPHNALAISSPDYRGEVFVDGTAGEASYQLWSPNRLIVDVKAKGEGMVIVNQNYYPGWRATGGQAVESVNGRLGVKVTPQVQRVELYYLPTLFVVGALVSAITVILLAAWFRKLPKTAAAYADALTLSAPLLP